MSLLASRDLQELLFFRSKVHFRQHIFMFFFNIFLIVTRKLQNCILFRPKSSTFLWKNGKKCIFLSKNEKTFPLFCEKMEKVSTFLWKNGESFFFLWKNGESFLFFVKKWRKFPLFCEKMEKVSTFLSKNGESFYFFVKKWRKFPLFCQKMGKIRFFVKKWEKVRFLVKKWEKFPILCQNLLKNDKHLHLFLKLVQVCCGLFFL